MAIWSAFDSKNDSLKNWLNQFRTQRTITSTLPSLEWRQMDSNVDIATKVLRCHNVAYSTPDTIEYSWRPLDSENDVYRKILNSLRYGVNPALSGSEYEWRKADGSRDVLAKILRVLNYEAANSDATYFASPIDNEIHTLRKIAVIQASV